LPLNFILIKMCLDSRYLLDFLRKSNVADEATRAANKTIIVVGNSGAAGVGEGDLVGAGVEAAVG
jgi:hypothetical protein